MLDQPVRTDPDNAPTGPGETRFDRIYRLFGWAVVLFFCIGGMIYAALD